MTSLIQRIRAKTGFDANQISDGDLNVFIEEAKNLFEKLSGVTYKSSVMPDSIISDFVSGMAFNRVNGVDGIRSYKLGKLSVTKFKTWDGINYFFQEGLWKLKEYIGVGLEKTTYEETEVVKPTKVTEVSTSLEAN